MKKMPIVCNECKTQNHIEIPDKIKCKECSNKIELSLILKKSTLIGSMTLVMAGAVGTSYIDDLFDKRYPMKVEYKTIQNCIDKFSLYNHYTKKLRDNCICAVEQLSQEYSLDRVKQLSFYEYYDVIKPYYETCNHASKQ